MGVECCDALVNKSAPRGALARCTKLQVKRATNEDNAATVLVDLCEKTAPSTYPADSAGCTNLIKRAMQGVFPIQLAQWMTRGRSFRLRRQSSSSFLAKLYDENPPLRAMIDDVQKETSSSLCLSLKLLLVQRFENNELDEDSSHTDLQKLSNLLSGLYMIGCSDSGELILTRSDSSSFGEEREKPPSENSLRQPNDPARIHVGSVSVAAFVIPATAEVDHFIDCLVVYRERGTMISRVSSDLAFAALVSVSLVELRSICLTHIVQLTSSQRKEEGSCLQVPSSEGKQTNNLIESNLPIYNYLVSFIYVFFI